MVPSRRQSELCQVSTDLADRETRKKINFTIREEETRWAFVMPDCNSVSGERTIKTRVYSSVQVVTTRQELSNMRNFGAANTDRQNRNC